MPTYSVCDVAFESTISLPELSSVEYQEPEFSFTLDSGQSHHWDACIWLHTCYVGDDKPRLWRDSVEALFGQGKPLGGVAHYTKKKRVDGNVGLSFFNEAAPLRRIFFLAPPDEIEDNSVSIAPLSPRNAFMELVKFMYLID